MSHSSQRASANALSGPVTVTHIKNVCNNEHAPPIAARANSRISQKGDDYWGNGYDWLLMSGEVRLSSSGSDLCRHRCPLGDAMEGFIDLLGNGRSYLESPFATLCPIHLALRHHDLQGLLSSTICPRVLRADRHTISLLTPRARLRVRQLCLHLSIGIAMLAACSLSPALDYVIGDSSSR